MAYKVKIGWDRTDGEHIESHTNAETQQSSI